MLLVFAVQILKINDRKHERTGKRSITTWPKVKSYSTHSKILQILIYFCTL